MDTETNLPEAEVEETVDTLETEASDTPDLEESEASEPETVEIEINGKTYSVPAELKDSFLMQSDYTRKTQELAAERKALGEAKERVQQAGEAEVTARARVMAYEAAIGEYQGVDWDALEMQDPVAAQRHFRKFMQLNQELDGAKAEYQSAVQQRTLETQQEAATRIEQGLAELQRDIPDWGPAKAEELMAFGEKQFGFSRDYMESITDPKLVKLMHFAHLAQKSALKPAVKNEAIKPASKVKGGGQPVVGLDDRLSTDEWMKRRNEQLRRK